jgi:hypothetical protein
MSDRGKGQEKERGRLKEEATEENMTLKENNNKPHSCIISTNTTGHSSRTSSGGSWQDLAAARTECRPARP